MQDEKKNCKEQRIENECKNLVFKKWLIHFYFIKFSTFIKVPSLYIPFNPCSRSIYISTASREERARKLFQGTMSSVYLLLSFFVLTGEKLACTEVAFHEVGNDGQPRHLTRSRINVRQSPRKGVRPETE